MPVRARNTVPAIKDHVARIGFALTAIPPGTGFASSFFMNPWYDFEVKSITALVRTITTAVASPFTLGYGAYTNQHGVIVPANFTFFLTAANCFDATGASFSNGILPLGSLHVLPVPADNGQGSTILPAGAPLVVAGTNTANTGQVMLTVILRPKDWDRGDSSKRPWGSSDDAFASYYK